MKQILNHTIVLFFLWPFLALVYAFKYYKDSRNKDVLTLFSGFIGLTYVIFNFHNDANTYVERFAEYSSIEFSGFLKTFINYITFKGDVDVAQDFIYFFLSRFTDNYIYLFAIFGLFFGYFYSRNIWMALGELRNGININSLYFLVALLFIIPITHGINQFRFWVASMIFIYGALNFVYFGRKKGLLLAAFSLTVHFGFIVPFLVLFTYKLLGNRDKIYIFLLVLSIVFSELYSNLVSGIEGLLFGEFEARVDAYTGEEFTNKLASRDRVWYADGWQEILKIMFYGFIFWIEMNYKKKLRPNLKNTYSFILMLLIVFNFINGFSMIFRYLPVVYFIMFWFLMLFFDQFGITKFNLMTLWFFPPIFLMLLIQMSSFFRSLNIFAVMSNPFFAVFLENDISFGNFFN